MTETRHTASTITDDALDALYRRLDAYRDSRRRWMESAYDDRRWAVNATARVEHVRAACDALDGDVTGLGPMALAGRRDAVARIRAALTRAATEATQPAEHTGGNAEDYPRCCDTNPPYPFLCTGA